MNAGERTRLAITITREILTNMMDDPGAMVAMTMDLVKPDNVEDTVSEILEYLDRTKPKASAELAE